MDRKARDRRLAPMGVAHHAAHTAYALLLDDTVRFTEDALTTLEYLTLAYRYAALPALVSQFRTEHGRSQGGHSKARVSRKRWAQIDDAVLRIARGVARRRPTTWAHEDGKRRLFRFIWDQLPDAVRDSALSQFRLTEVDEEACLARIRRRYARQIAPLFPQ